MQLTTAISTDPVSAHKRTMLTGPKKTALDTVSFVSARAYQGKRFVWINWNPVPSMTKESARISNIGNGLKPTAPSTAVFADRER